MTADSSIGGSEGVSSLIFDHTSTVVINRGWLDIREVVSILIRYLSRRNKNQNNY